MTVTITGMAALLRNIQKARKAAETAAEKNVDRARLAVETTAKKLIAKGPKSGILYHRPQTKVKRNLSEWHRASAPGQPPATDTGILINSIESKREGMTAWVWTEKEYGKWLEFGTRDIAPRPWLGPAVDKNKERFPKELGAAVIQSIDEAVKK